MHMLPFIFLQYLFKTIQLQLKMPEKMLIIGNAVQQVRGASPCRLPVLSACHILKG